MLPSAFRMRRSVEFAAVLRGGRSARRGSVVVHLRPDVTQGPVRVGLVVGGRVGNSVTRHRVSRRLRAQLASRIGSLPDGSGVVVRALPSAGSASSAELAGDLDRALPAVLASGSLR